MQPVNILLDKIKVSRSLASDNALAMFLHTTRGSVSNWRHGKNFPDAITCARIADATGMPLAKVLGIVGEARAISRDEKAVWKRLASAAALFLLVAATPLPGDARDSARRAGSGRISCNSPDTAYYVRRLRRLARFLLARIVPVGSRNDHAELLAL